MRTKTFRVVRWAPEEKQFVHVGDPFWDLARARERAAIERLQNSDAQFAVFDQDGNMVEDEAGKLVT
jgi:hypothetical protein